MAALGVDLFQDPLFLAFAKQRPVATMAQMALRHLLDSQALLGVFQENAQSQREAVIPFAALTKMMATVVLNQEPSVNAAIKKMEEELRASHQAVYGKLRRLEPSIACGLVTYSFQRSFEMQRNLGSFCRHDLTGLETRILDGNHLAATEHRLKETRDTTAAPLPGKMLVVYSPRYDAIVECFAIEDGHAQERSALDAVIETLRARQLWIADRNFCTLKFLYGIIKAGSRFIIRQHGQLEGEPVGQPRRIGKTETGVVFEQKFQLPKFEGSKLMIRRVIVKLKKPTRDGDYEIYVLTNLLAEEADALEIAEEYRKRWRIETVMQVLTEALRCEIKPLCYPKAALFGFAISLVMYNALSIVKAAIKEAHDRETVQTLSHFYMALEITQTTDGMLIALPPSRWTPVEDAAPEQLALEMLRIAKQMNLTYYIKSTRGAKKPKPKPTHEKRNVHLSTKKLLDQRTK
jgi:IS4 transposase